MGEGGIVNIYLSSRIVRRVFIRNSMANGVGHVIVPSLHILDAPLIRNIAGCLWVLKVVPLFKFCCNIYRDEQVCALNDSKYTGISHIKI